MSSAALPRLLVLTSTMPRWRNDTDPRFIEYLCYELARSFEVVVLAPHCAGAERRETLTNGKQSIAVVRFRYFVTGMQSLAYEGGMLSRVRSNPLRLLLLPFFLIAELRAMAKLEREYRFDAIHAHWIIPHGFVAAFFRLLSRAAPPTLVTSHGGDLFALRGALMRRLKLWVLKRVTGITVVSEAMRDYCVALGLGADRIVVRSMGVDLQTMFTPPEPDAERNDLVFVGRLVEKKGVQHLVEAMALLVQDSPQLRLTIVGDGPLRGELEQLAATLQLQSHVHFAGSVPNIELPGYLRRAKIAVMPSVVAESGDQEGLGLVAVEAMGCGCAVVASDLPAVRDVIRDGETGLMATPADAQDLAARIARLLADDDLCQTLARQGRRYARENFDWPIVGECYADLLNGLQRP